MSEIRVNWAELLAAANAIDAARGVGDQVASSRGALDAAGSQSGRGDVSGAIGSFLESWSYGVRCVDQDAETLAKFLRLAGDEYKQAEAAIAAGAEP